MTVVTKKPSATSRGKVKDAVDAIATPAPVDMTKRIEQVRHDLREYDAQLAGVRPYESRYDAIQERSRALRAELEELELDVLPMPAAMALSFLEAEPLIAVIKTTGNHREKIDGVGLRQLARSITTHGLQQRIGLRALGDGSYELIFGARRLAATKLAGKESIQAKVYPRELTPAQVEILRTIENFGRQDLTPVEKALAVARTIDAIGETLQAYETAGLSGDGESEPAYTAGRELQQQMDLAGGLYAYVGQQLGFTEKWIRDHAYVSQLGGEARALLAAERISIAHARELARLGDKAAADDIAGMVAKDEDGLGGEPVEDCRRMVIERLRSLKGVPWELNVAFGAGVKGCTGYACSTCQFNSKTEPDLFAGVIADEPQQGTCTNGACYEAKQKIVAGDIAKIVAKVKPKIDGDKLEATESALREFIPLHVRASSATRKVKKETGDAPKKSSGAGRGGREEKKDPIVVAKENYEKQAEDWAKKSAKLIVDRLDAPEQRFALEVLVHSLSLLRRPRYYLGWQATDATAEAHLKKELKQLEKPLSSPAFKKIVDAVASPTLAGLVAARPPGGHDLHWSLQSLDTRALTKLADKLDVKLPTLPDREAIVAAVAKPTAGQKPAEPKKAKTSRKRRAE